MESVFVSIGKFEFPKIRGTFFWVVVIRILLFRVLYWGPLFSETPKCESVHSKEPHVLQQLFVVESSVFDSANVSESPD